MKVKVLDKSGKETGREVNLPEDLFGIEPNDHCIYLAVKQQMANKRTGTHKAKERGEVKGSTRKIKKQKGTGTARAGDIKNPLFRGGGRVFGPRPRSYSFKLNKKVKDLARKSALSYKAKNEDIMVVEDLSFDTPKTKDYINVLSNLGVYDVRTLMVLSENNNNVYKSSSNIPQAEVLSSADLNTYGILKAKKLILTESSVKALAEAK